MAHFTKGGGDRTPFGRNQILRSTKPGSYLDKSYTCAGNGGTEKPFPVEQIDGHDECVLQVGEVLAKITSGDNEGKVGVFTQGAATDGRADVENIIGVCKDLYATELSYRDVEVAVIYQGSLVQGWCTVRDASGKRIPLPNATADELRGKKNLQILFD